MASLRCVYSAEEAAAVIFDLPSPDDSEIDSDFEDQAMNASENPLVSTSSPREEVKEVLHCNSEHDGSLASVNNSPVVSSGHDSPVLLSRAWAKRVSSTDLPLFSLASGAIQSQFEACETATDFFIKFWNEQLIEHLLFQSNLYAVQEDKRGAALEKNEFYGFLGLTMFFGYHSLPAIRDYWSTDIDYYNQLVSDTMSRDRYFFIRSILHCNDNNNMPDNNRDKLYKVRPLIENLNETFQALKAPNRWQSIDESMILFKGRSSIKQYQPLKPIKRGYKLWCRSDMEGYIYQFDVYQGKDNSDPGKSKSLGEKVVWNLAQSLVGKNYALAFDNFFTSLPLLEHLKEHCIFACGTVRPNRKGLPRLADDKELERGDFDFQATKQGITFFKWKDNKSVYLLSNFHGSEVTTLKRTQKDGSEKDVSAPLAVADYNKQMGGVDKAGMLRACYDLDRKSRKWWHRIFFALLEMALINSYVVFCEVTAKIPLLAYKRRVAMGLLTLSRSPKKARVRPRTSAEIPSRRRKCGFSVPPEKRLKNLGAHWPEFLATRGRCELCSTVGTESRPYSRCSVCNVHLCCNASKNCFTRYHCA